MDLSSDDPFPITGGSSIFSPQANQAFASFPATPLISAAKESVKDTHNVTNTNTRKRPRSSNSGKVLFAENGKGVQPQAAQLTADLKSLDPNNVISALNTLLRLSADHDLNYALGKGGHEVIQALVDLFDETIDWTHGDAHFEKEEESPGDTSNQKDLEPSSETWEFTASPSKLGAKPLIEERDWATFCSIRFAPSTLNTAMTPSHIMPSNILLENPLDKDAMKVLEIILMILRNLSYVAQNMRYMTQTVGVLRLLTGSLYFRNFITGKTERGPKSEREESGELGTGNSYNNICLHAIQTFHNLAPLIDATGRKVFRDLHLLDGSMDMADHIKSNRAADSVDVKTVVRHEDYARVHKLGVGGMYLAKRFDVRDESLGKIPNVAIRSVVGKYIRATLKVFPALGGTLFVTTSRSVVVATLELMKELIDNPDNHQVFICVSDMVLYQLTRLLWIPRLGPDSLEYVCPLINMVTRVSALKLLGEYDSAVDYELRDRSLELLVKLTGLNNDLKVRVGRKIVTATTENLGINIVKSVGGTNPRLYEALVPALLTKVGRDATPQLAATLLSNLAMVPENQTGLLYAQRKILRAAGNADPNLAKILHNSVLCQIQI